MIEVRYARIFTRQMKKLRKAYPHVGDDVDVLVERLREGETPGDQIPGIGYTAYKVRVRSRDTGHGKRGGYRVVYYLRTPHQILMLVIYVKTRQEEISRDFIRRIIEEELGNL